MNMFEYQKPLLIAHRGYTPAAPENSLASFNEAAKRHYWAIETDVHSTKDGVLVCCHNKSLLHMFGIDVVIENTKYDELKSYRICKGNNIEKLNDDLLRIPLFEEYLKICKDSGCVAFIETKGNVVAPVIDMVKYMKLTDRAVLSSIQYDHIVQARSISDIFVHHIFSDHQKMLEISQMGNGGVSYNYPNLDDVPYGLIEQTHKHNVKVCLRAGDNRDTVNRMLALGLDYIPTNCFVPESKAPQKM